MSGALRITLAEEQLRELADLVVARLTQAALPPETYDQDTLPPGIPRRVYLEAARAGAVVTSKIGRRVIVTRADLDGWLEARRQKVARSPSTPANDTKLAVIQPDLAAIIEANGARVG